MTRPTAALALAVALAGCAPALPDPESAGAEVYRLRCGGCHRLYAPGILTAAMWEVQVARMREVMVRRGVNPLTQQERHLVLAYLQAHASDVGAAAAATP